MKTILRFCCVLVTLLLPRTHAQTFFENFESGIGAWTITGNAGWEVGVPTNGPAAGASGNRAHEGTGVAATVLGGNYTDNTTGSLVGGERNLGSRHSSIFQVIPSP